MERNKIEIKDTEEKKSSKVKKFFYNIFVKNIGYKAIALGVAIVLWVILVGLGM